MSGRAIQIHLQSMLLCLLGGMVLGQRFRVPTVIVVAAVLALILVANILRGDGFWSSALSTIAAAVCLQIGYLFGLGIRYLLIGERPSKKSEPTGRAMP
jgi:hypothetical protein